MRSISLAGAQTGIGRDASSVFHNPGAMTFQEYSQISAGVAISLPSTSYLSPYTGNFNAKDQIYTPVHVYAVGKLRDEKSAIGISINTPYHMRSSWEDSWPGKYISIESNSKTICFQPTYSYQFSETFGAGLGAVVGYGTTYLKKAVPVASSSGDVLMELEGNSLGFGFNIGLFYKPTDEFRAGLNYRSSMKMKVKEGEASFSNVPSTLGSVYTNGLSFSTEQTIPAVITAGAAYDLTRDLTLCIDINYTMWNVYDSLAYDFEGNSSLDFGSGRFYENAFAFRVGAEYRTSDKIAVRAGAAFDKSPVPDDYVTPDVPDADRFMFSAGGTIRFGDSFSADIAYMLQNIKERESLNKETLFAGSYKSLINVFGITLNYFFAQ